jgi:hypothetical protein
MKRTKLRYVLPALALALLLVVSCATQSRLISSWSLHGKDVGPFDTVVVFALMQDEARSRTVAIAAVEKLNETEVDAIPGFTVLENEREVDIDKMEERVEAVGADAVLIYKVMALDRDLRYVRPTAYVTDGASRYGWWDDPVWGYYTPYPYHYWGYWYPASQVTVSPGYWEAYDTYRVETVLYRTSDNRLVWSAVSETYNPDDRSDLGRSLTRRIVQTLERERIIDG